MLTVIWALEGGINSKGHPCPLITPAHRDHNSTVTSDMHSYEQDVLDMQQAVEELRSERRVSEGAMDEKLLPPLREFKNIHILAEHRFLGVQQIDLQIPLVYTEQEAHSIRSLTCEKGSKCKSVRMDEALNPALLTIVVVNIFMFAIIGMLSAFPRISSL
eukprot:757112-Hanusia_phi.AAC.1